MIYKPDGIHEAIISRDDYGIMEVEGIRAKWNNIPNSTETKPLSGYVTQEWLLAEIDTYAEIYNVNREEAIQDLLKVGLVQHKRTAKLLGVQETPTSGRWSYSDYLDVPTKYRKVRE